MIFSINDYISQNEKILWRGNNIYCPPDPSEVIVTNKKIICCSNKHIEVIPIDAITLVACTETANETAEVRVCAAGGGTQGSALMHFVFINNDSLCKNFLQILLNQI